MLRPTPEDIAYMKAHVDDDRRSVVISVNTTCLILAFVAVGLRVFARRKIGTKIGLDDYLIIIAACLLAGHVGCLLTAVRFGMGRHAILVKHIKPLALSSLIAQTFYNLCINVIKLSILCLYARIFQRSIGWFIPTLYGTATFVGLLTIPQCLVYIFKCVPIDSAWTDYGPNAKMYCLDFKAAIVAFGVINILTDWWILALPIPIVLGLHLERRAKWSICSLFLVGLSVCVVSIIRLFYAKHAETLDPSWDFVPLSLISTAEACTGIIAACMPTWRPLFNFLRNGVNSYFSSDAKGSNPSNLPYGNTSRFSRNRSRSRPHSAHVKIDHKGMGTGMLDGMRGAKRSETSMSGESVEKMLRPTDIEMHDTKPRPDLGVGTGAPAPPGRGPAPKKQAGPLLTFYEPGTAYEATAGADRWEGLMKQQRLKNESDERGRGRAASPKPKGKGRYGEVAYGGARLSTGGEALARAGSARVGPASEEERRRAAGLGLGLDGIVVTKTVSSTTTTEEPR